LKTEIECPLCGQRLKISLKENGKISEKDRKAKLKQHIIQSKTHSNLWLPPSGSPKKLKQVLRDLGLEPKKGISHEI